MHARYLKQIGKYCLSTCNKGMILHHIQDTALTVDCYVDADFAGLWCVEDNQDPHCVKSCTGYVIVVADCPVIWGSNLQTIIAQSNMES
eukprot:14093502-Ditylum_brightwellii.AAC.1